MTRLAFTLSTAAGDVDVRVTPVDPPDRAVGLLGWTYDLTAERGGVACELAGDDLRAAEWEAEQLLGSRRHE